jgi:hypothetical protein
MAYGKNSPFGLRTYGHLISGVDDIKTNSNYTISGNSFSLNKGDPVICVPQNLQYGVVANGYQGKQQPIMLYNPIVTPAAAGNACTVIGANAVAGQPIAGVFQGCEYYTPNGTWVSQEYWQAGTATNGKPVTAIICDDPYVIYDIQLSSYTGAMFAAPTQFALLPCMQIQDGSWPDTGAANVGANATATIANSRVIGSNITLMTGSNVGAAGVGASTTMTGITSWQNGAAAVAGYKDNPLLANQGNAALGGNPWGTSTFYACPSLAYTAANPIVINGTNDYSQLPAAAGNLRVLGFTPNPNNVPATYGQPGNAATAGNYFNTPFLNVLVMINNHVDKPGNVGVTLA